MATSASRKVVRDKLAELLQTELVTTLGIAQAVYAYRIGDFAGASPVVVVSSGGSRRERLSFQGQRPVYYLTIHVFVLYNDEAGTWDESDAEDALDGIEAGVNNVVAANPSLSDFWISLAHSDRSSTGSVEISGVEYRTEIFEVTIS